MPHTRAVRPAAAGDGDERHGRVALIMRDQLLGQRHRALGDKDHGDALMHQLLDRVLDGLLILRADHAHPKRAEGEHGLPFADHADLFFISHTAHAAFPGWPPAGSRPVCPRGSASPPRPRADASAGSRSAARSYPSPAYRAGKGRSGSRPSRAPGRAACPWKAARQ